VKVIRNILLIALALLVQSTLFGKLDLYGVRPDIPLIMLIILAGVASPTGLIYYGFFIGFLQDVYSPEYLGYNAFAMSLTAFFLEVVKERLTVENYTVRLIMTLLACTFHDSVYLLLYTAFDLSVLAPLFVRESLPGAAYTAVLAMILVMIWQWAQSGGLFGVLRELMGNGR